MIGRSYDDLQLAGGVFGPRQQLMLSPNLCSTRTEPFFGRPNLTSSRRHQAHQNSGLRAEGGRRGEAGPPATVRGLERAVRVGVSARARHPYGSVTVNAQSIGSGGLARYVEGHLFPSAVMSGATHRQPARHTRRVIPLSKSTVESLGGRPSLPQNYSFLSTTGVCSKRLSKVVHHRASGAINDERTSDGHSRRRCLLARTGGNARACANSCARRSDFLHTSTTAAVARAARHPPFGCKWGIEGS